MPQVAKIDPSSATLRELADATQLITQGITAPEIKFEKKWISLYPFGQILNFYIPRGYEMNIHDGFLSLDRWGAAHFLTHRRAFPDGYNYFPKLSHFFFPRFVRVIISEPRDRCRDQSVR